MRKYRQKNGSILTEACFADFDYKVWEISYYCINTSQQKPTALLSRKLLSISRRNSQRGGSTIDTKPPPLLVSFRAHLKPVISLDFVDNRQFIISASTDASVRLWTQSGRYIGNMLKTNSGDELPPPPPPHHTHTHTHPYRLLAS